MWAELCRTGRCQTGGGPPAFENPRGALRAALANARAMVEAPEAPAQPTTGRTCSAFPGAQVGEMGTIRALRGSNRRFLSKISCLHRPPGSLQLRHRDDPASIHDRGHDTDSGSRLCRKSRASRSSDGVKVLKAVLAAWTRRIAATSASSC